jgi:hypothetical protein
MNVKLNGILSTAIIMSKIVIIHKNTLKQTTKFFGEVKAI